MEIQKIFNPPPRSNSNLFSFDDKLSMKDFLKSSTITKNYLGYLEDTFKLTYRKDSKLYSLKLLKKIHFNRKENIKEILDSIYSNENESAFKPLAHCEDEEQVCFIYEDIPNVSLLQKISFAKLKEETLLSYYRQILEAVKYLNKKKYYGLMTNPSTIIFDKNERLCLTDLGFSKMLPEKKDIYTHYLENGFIYNEFMSPELLIGKMTKARGSNNNEKTDIWQIGVLFYMMASKGQKPFEASNDYDIFNSIIKGNVTFSYLNDYSSFVLQFIAKMLKRNPNERYLIDQLLSYDNFTQLTSKSVKMLNTLTAENTQLNLCQSLRVFPNNKNRRSNNGSPVIKKNLSMSHSSISARNALLTKLSNQIIDLEKDKKSLHDENTNYYYLFQLASELIDETETQLDDSRNEISKQTISSFERLNLSKNTNQMYNELITNKVITESQYQSIIRNLIFEIQLMKIDLQREKTNNTNLEDKIASFEAEKNTLINEHKQKIKFYESKIQLMENIIFPDNDANDFNSNSNYYLSTLKNSLDCFKEINEDLLRKSKLIEKGMMKELQSFLHEKEVYVQEIVKAKQDFQKEILYILSQDKSANDEDKKLSGKRLGTSGSIASHRKDSSSSERIMANKLKILLDEIHQLKEVLDKNKETMSIMQKEINNKKEEIEMLEKKFAYFNEVNVFKELNDE